MMRITGKILRYYKDRGYGWIETPEKENLFYHNSEVPGRRSLDPGTEVSFEVALNAKGQTRAVKIEVLSEPESASGQNVGVA